MDAKTNNTTSTITRRQALKASGAAALAALSIPALAGCAQEEEGAMLPLGSVVVIKGFEDSGIKHVIVDRCPYVSDLGHVETDGTVNESETGVLPDYAVVYYPFGSMGDRAEAPSKASELYINEDAISEVVFRGYSDDYDKRAAELLVQGKENGQPSFLSLADMLSELAETNKAE